MSVGICLLTCVCVVCECVIVVCTCMCMCLMGVPGKGGSLSIFRRDY